MNKNYYRVLPRDLFNEAKLLKCIGRLALLVEDHMIEGLEVEHDGSSFQIALLDEGALICTNVRFKSADQYIVFKTTYNSKRNYSLYLQHDYVDYLVFDEQGEFDEEFSSFWAWWKKNKLTKTVVDENKTHS